jgi:tetratricopeptide (TPR) repeat protein
VEPLPLWLDEGIAELVATGDLRDGVGGVSPEHLTRLQEQPWLPLPSLFSMGLASSSYRNEAQAPIFYAQAWALVHYLELADGGEQAWRLSSFVGLLARGVTDADAAEQAFGDLGVLKRRLEDYVRSGRLQSTSWALPLLAKPADPQATRLPPAQVALTLGDFLGHVDPSDAPLKLLEQAGREGLMAQSLEKMSLIELRRKEFDAALQHADEALALDSTLAAAYFARAAARVAQPQPPETVIDLAERDLKEALRLDDGFAPAYSLLGTLFTIRNRRVDEAPGLIRRAVRLDPAIVMYRVALAQALLAAGEPEEAEHIAIRIVARARSAQEREIGQKPLEITSSTVASHRHP